VILRVAWIIAVTTLATAAPARADDAVLHAEYPPIVPVIACVLLSTA